MLQSLLQPRDTRSKMIGAMPAVAVRHERRRGEKRGGGVVGRRPSQLPLPLGRPDLDATPSSDHRRFTDLSICGKVAILHAIVGSLLLGIVLLVVGVVQMSPGAEAAQHRYYLMGVGAALTGTGLVAAVMRCICLHMFARFHDIEDVEGQPEPQHTAHKNGVSVVEGGHGHDKHDRPAHDKTCHDKFKIEHDKPKLKSQTSVSRDIDLMKQASAASDT